MCSGAVRVGALKALWLGFRLAVSLTILQLLVDWEGSEPYIRVRLHLDSVRRHIAVKAISLIAFNVGQAAWVDRTRTTIWTNFGDQLETFSDLRNRNGVI